MVKVPSGLTATSMGASSFLLGSSMRTQRTKASLGRLLYLSITVPAMSPPYSPEELEVPLRRGSAPPPPPPFPPPPLPLPPPGNLAGSLFPPPFGRLLSPSFLKKAQPVPPRLTAASIRIQDTMRTAHPPYGGRIPHIGTEFPRHYFQLRSALIRRNLR